MKKIYILIDYSGFLNMRAVQAQRLLMPTEGAALELLLPEATFSICKLRLASVVSLATAIVICTREIFSPQICSPN